MQEELISLETAKLANDKGWKFPYTIEYLEEIEGTVKYFDSLPTQGLLQRWLREKHNIHLAIIPNFCNITCNLENFTIQCFGKYGREEFVYEFNTYEQAFEVGLQKGLELIKI